MALVNIYRYVMAEQSNQSRVLYGLRDPEAIILVVKRDIVP